MATIPGSQLFDATAALPVNIVETTTGTGIGSDTVGGDFNLEVFVGTPGTEPPKDPGYDGYAVMTPDGHYIDLISGAYAITDLGSGNSIIVHGTNETVNVGANDYVEVDGTSDTVNGGIGPEVINVNGSGNTVNAGSGSDVITVLADGNTVNGGSGPDTITAIGNNETITGGTGPELINVVGTGAVITAGSGADTINVFGGGNDTITAGSGADVIGAYADNVSVTGGSGTASIFATGSGDTVTAGSGNLSIDAFAALGTNFQFNDSANLYADTVVGFDQPAGDRVHLTGVDTITYAVTNQINSGGDTLITLNDGSTILLKGVASIDNTFFN